MPEQQEPASFQAQDQIGCERPVPQPLIRDLIPDPNAVPDARVLTGFLGEASRTDDQGQRWWRLYLTLQLNNYLEFPKGAVVCGKSLGTDQSPLGGWVLWVRRDAPLQQIRTTQIRAQDEVEGGCNIPPVVCAFQARTCTCNPSCPGGSVPGCT
jgi:hypothetical protein